MGLFDRIRRHAAVAGANFESMFRDTDTIPPFPAAAARLVAELNRTDAQIEEFASIISAAPDISAKILQAVNSSLVAPKSPVNDISQAVSLLGINHIKQIATAHVVRKSVPLPDDALFDHEAFWADSLLMALVAREFAKRTYPSEAELCFTSALLSDIALPVLLSSWQEYYSPVIEEWKESERSLSEIERESFRWDHAQAGAWIAKHWGLPEELVCMIGVHNLTHEEAERAGLRGAAADPLRVAAGISSLLRPDRAQSARFLDDALSCLALSLDVFEEAVGAAANSFEEVRRLFDVQISGDQVVRDVMILVDERKEAMA